MACDFLARRTTRSALLALALAMAGVGTSAPSYAAQSSEHDRAAARALVADAEKKAAARDYAGAYELFAQAYTLVAAPTVRRQMGRMRLNSGKLLDAYQILAEVAASTAQQGEHPSWAKARQQAKAEAEQLEARLGKLEVQVEGPSAADVTMNGKPFARDRLGREQKLDAGSYNFRAIAEGFVPAEHAVTLAEGERTKIVIRMQSTKKPVEAIEPPPVEASTASGPAPSRTASTVAFVAGGGFLAIGAVTGVVALTSMTSVKAQCAGGECPPSLSSKAGTARTMGTISLVGFVLAGGSAVAGVILWPKKGPSQPARGSVGLQLGVGEFYAVGRF